MDEPKAHKWTPELLRQRRRRAVIMAIFLFAGVVMFFLVTLVRLRDNVAPTGF